MLSAHVNHYLLEIKNSWNKQSRSSQYAAIIGLSIPSFLLLRELYWYFYREYHSLPPGPNGLPLFGMMFAWNSSSAKRINLSKKYGPIFHSTMMGITVITLSSSKLVKQVFPRKEFLNREPFLYPTTDYHPSMTTHGQTHEYGLFTRLLKI